LDVLPGDCRDGKWVSYLVGSYGVDLILPENHIYKEIRMKRISIIMIALIPILFLTSCKDKESMSSVEKFSYALGMDAGRLLLDFETEIDPTAFKRGVDDVLKGNVPLFTPEEVASIKIEMYAKMRASQAEKNRREGEEFLVNNKKREDVITTKSGLQYTIVTKGTGPRPKKTDKVKAHYKGTFVDGTEFDSSYKRGEPALFQLDKMIPGWTEAIQLMNVGSKYRFFIPSNLAYGEQGAPPLIGPNAMLIFEVELLGIEK
jgi:FKBP-type peptidyl-prolyl cis-trans isomerase FkpA